MDGSTTPMDARAPKDASCAGDDSASRRFAELRDRLLDPDWSDWSDTEFEERAAAAFRHQFETCEPYRAFCTGRGVTPDNVASWEEVPAVPATAFKYFDFVSVIDGGVHGTSFLERGTTFLTSGTTQGAEARGRHHVPDPELYRASLAEPFRRALLPELEPSGGKEALFLSLIPSPADAPDSSLSFMVGAAAERFARETVWLVEGDGGWREDAFSHVAEAVAGSERHGAPVLLLGTALSYLHLIEAVAGGRAEDGSGGDTGPAAALRRLPEGTRVMETGGFKGSRREVSRDALYRGIEKVTGVARDRIVNEYGMTELLSQLYETPLSESGGRDAGGGEFGDGEAGGRGSGDDGLHRPPPWLRVRAVDPVDLRPLPDGKDGILAFFDLANLASVCHVLTEDVGSMHGGRVRLRGRALGSEPRGCSRAMDELMTAARG